MLLYIYLSLIPCKTNVFPVISANLFAVSATYSNVLITTRKRSQNPKARAGVADDGFVTQVICAAEQLNIGLIRWRLLEKRSYTKKRNSHVSVQITQP